MRDIIVSVGTSLLTNADSGAGHRRPWQGWRHGNELPSADSGIAFLSGLETVSQASAETNTLAHLPLRDGDHVHWLHSDTPECKFCAEVLCAHYTTAGFVGELHSVAGMGFHESAFAEMGLRSLVTEAFQIIAHAERRGAGVEICATGGFKVELAYLSLVGILSGYSVYYMHEMFRQLVSLPPLPVSWHLDLVADNLAFFEWIDVEPRRDSDVEGRLAALPDLQMMVVYHQGHGYLSPAGEVLFQAYRQHFGDNDATWPPASPIAPHEKCNISKTEHHRPSGFDKYLAKLLDLPWVSQVTYHDGGPPTSDSVVATIYSTQEGKLRVRYTSDFGITVLVETTARDEQQCQLLVGFLNRKGKDL